MIRAVLNLFFYFVGLSTLFAFSFAGVMRIGIESDNLVIAAMIVSPLVIWAECWAYNYFFEGCELLLKTALESGKLFFEMAGKRSPAFNEFLSLFAAFRAIF